MFIIDLFVKGGYVMYPLLICSIIAVVILIERLRTYNKEASNMKVLREELPALIHARNWSGVESLCQEDGGAAARLLATAVQRSHDKETQNQVLQGAAGTIAAGLRKYLNYLETIVTLAPLLGLLGTVTVMIGSFSVLSIQSGEPFAITGGVGEALIATATGLCVAILALIIHAYLVQRQDNLISEMEEASTIYMTAMAGERDAA